MRLVGRELEEEKGRLTYCRNTRKQAGMVKPQQHGRLMPYDCLISTFQALIYPFSRGA